MKACRLDNKIAKGLLEEIRIFLEDNMGWIAQGGEEDGDLFILSNEMKVVHDKIQNYLKNKYEKIFKISFF